MGEVQIYPPTVINGLAHLITRTISISFHSPLKKWFPFWQSPISTRVHKSVVDEYFGGRARSHITAGEYMRFFHPLDNTMCNVCCPLNISTQHILACLLSTMMARDTGQYYICCIINMSKLAICNTYRSKIVSRHAPHRDVFAQETWWCGKAPLTFVEPSIVRRMRSKCGGNETYLTREAAIYVAASACRASNCPTHVGKRNHWGIDRQNVRGGAVSISGSSPFSQNLYRNQYNGRFRFHGHH